MSKTILVVDDSSSVRYFVKDSLSSNGYNVIEAHDGLDGLDKLNGQKVHAIISDVNMPRMDGLTMVSEIKKIPAYKFTPIVMLTTESQQKLKDKGRSLGVKAWMVKPFGPEKMLAALEKLVP